MNILIAPNAFKNSLSANETGKIIKEAWLDINPHDTITIKPMADGGDGFSEVIGKEKGGIKINVNTKNALGQNYIGFYFKVNNATAIIELAANCGMQTISSNQLNALETNTEGLGIVIKQAIQDGCTEIILGLGGSASTDFGLGAIYALGGKFFTIENTEIIPNGRNLDLIQHIDTSDLSKITKGIHFYMALDVDNTLLGEKGASKVFAPQKGATISEVNLLEYSLKQIAHLSHKITGIDVENIIGGGVAGGTAAGFVSFLNAKPLKGTQFVMETLNLHKEIENADLVITTEGCIDSQSLKGKAPFVIAQLATENNTPCIGLVGSNLLKGGSTHPFFSVFNINRNWTTLEDAINNTSENLEYTTHQIAKLIKFKK